MNALVQAFNDLRKPLIKFDTQEYNETRINCYCDYLDLYVTHSTECEYDHIYGDFRAEVKIQKIEMHVVEGTLVDATDFITAQEAIFDSLQKFIGDQAMKHALKAEMDRIEAMLDCDQYDYAEARGGI